MNNGLTGPNPSETVTGGKTLELSKYDKVRKPHKVITDDTKIKVTARSLSAELCCPICLDLLTCTMTTKECLHRFCQECITTALMRGNKECPTCRKKIVSKRSLRPDPNFDLLISKIWPDRKQYDAELSASMQLFQEQSNVQSLQKSIEEGIKAQAAYRKQRVQGSYDYEKRKRRPPKLAEAGGKLKKQNSPDEIEESGTSNMGGMVEQVTVPLAPANLDGNDQQMEESQMEIDSSGDEEETSGADDSSSDDSSSISSDSSISSSSASSSFSSATNNAQKSEKLWENQIEQTMDEWRRKGGEDLEVELAPTKLLLRRESVLICWKMARYIRTSSETTISAIAEFLLNTANKFLMAQSASASAAVPSSSISVEPSPQSSSILVSTRPEHFFILDRNQKMRKLDPSNTLAFAFLQSIQWDRHLIIYFDLDECPEENIIEGIIGEEMAKTIINKKEEEKEKQPNVRQQQIQMEEVALKNDGEGNNQQNEIGQ